jgi:outer membrane protein OmpA-like peptidoglycan-associated protein
VIFVLTNPKVMKTKLSLIFFIFLGTCMLVGEVPPVLKKQNSNYVVIGAFAHQDNAIHFTEMAKKDQLDAQFEINPTRKLFYVYVLHTDDRKLAFEQAQSLRVKSSFSDTWVFTGMLGEGTQGIDVNPETGEKLKQIANEDKHIIASDEPVKENQPTLAVVENKETIQTEKVSESPVPTKSKDGRTFFFKIFKSSNQKELTGEVDIIDKDKNKKSASYTGNQDVFVRSVNKSGNMLLRCEVFGYRKIETAIDFNKLESNEVISLADDKTVVSFELVRLRKGDIAVMYNVLFYKDAAIMRPESHTEVKSLLTMMQENPKMRIRIHGHTNGGSAGKIIEVGESKNFFSLSGTKEGFGSAKKLSEERAKIISDFLVSEGIDPARMEVKAWGGKKPIYEKDHSLAHSNVRVEIEIISD